MCHIGDALPSQSLGSTEKIKIKAKRKKHNNIIKLG